MFLIPRASGANGTKAFGTSSIGRRVDQDSIQEQSEIARKYSPIRKKLESIYRDIDADIKYIKRRGKEITELYPQKTATEIEVMNTVSSLQGTKLQTVKAMMATVKDEIQLENARTELFYKVSNGKTLGNIGGETIQSAAVIARGGISNGVRPGEIGSTLPVYEENNSYLNRHNGAEEYEDTSYFAVDAQETNIPQQVTVGGAQPPSTGVTAEPAIEDTHKSVIPETTYTVPEGSNYVENGADDDRFVSILGENNNGETAKYLIGDDQRSSFDQLNDKMSYATAAACLDNKLNIEGLNKKMHYDADRKVGWLRTYNAEGGIVSAESLTPLSIIGDVEVSESGGVTYATDRFNNTYSVVPDNIENMPDVLLEELKDSIRNS